MPIKCYRRSKSNHGFSLVELMTVIGIVGILASMAVNSFKRMKTKAMRLEAQINLTHIAKLQETFLDANGQYFPEGPLTRDFLLSSTTTNCTNANALGFALPNCESNRYLYNSRNIVIAGLANGYSASATEGKKPGTGPSFTASNRLVFTGCTYLLTDRLTYIVDSTGPRYDYLYQNLIDQNCL